MENIWWSSSQPPVKSSFISPWCYPHGEDDTQEFRGEHKYKKYIKS